MLSTVCILALVSQTQAGIFDTLFGVVKTVVNNNGQIQVGDIVKNVAMTNMINLPNIPGVDVGGLLNGVGGLVGMKIFGGNNNMAQPTATQPGVDPNAGGADPNAGGADPNAGGADPNAGGADPNAGANAGGSGAGGLLNTASNWFGNFFQPNAGANTDPSNSWLNVLSSGANALGGLTGGATMPTNDNGANNNNGANPVNPVMQPVVMSSKTGVGSPCQGVAGTCLDSSVSTCSSAFLSRKCPGPTEVRCCPSGGVAGNVMSGSQDPDQPVSSGSGSCSQYGGLVFPLASGSLAEISVNWGLARENGARCHAGLDIYTSGARTVVAMSDGVVTNIINPWYRCSGKAIVAILVYHESGSLGGKTINYGEVDPGSYSVSAGSRVSRGQRLGTATHCRMLHFELYDGRTSATQRWYPSSGRVGPGCASNSMGSKPRALLDPRPIIRCTMPSGARFRNGVGFLNSAELSSLQQDDDVEGEEPVKLDIGGIVGIVVAFLVLIAIAVGVVLFMRMRRSRQNSAASMTVPNAAYTTAAPADFGHFACSQCGKEYNYETDLKTHIATRHTSA
jgi:hypothetical protein